MNGRHVLLASVILAVGLSSCGATTRSGEAIDCTSAAAYELSTPLRTFETTDDLWFSGADATGATSVSPSTPDAMCGGGSGGSASMGGGSGGGAGGTGGDATSRASIGITLEAIGSEGRCGSQYAMVLRSAGHTDWGSLFGDWKLASAPGTQFCANCGPADATGYEGLAIWARSGVGDSAVTLLVDTWQTSASGTDGTGPAAEVCKIDCNAGSGTQSRDASGVITSQTYVSPPGTCGNSFQRQLELTSQWRLYVLPFSSFYQDLKPNMSASGLVPQHINGLTIRTAKEASVEIWIDDIAFYKRK